LKQYLRQYLPEYMVPARMVKLDRLPQTGNGKIDRQSLPEPEANASAEPVLPRDSAEAYLKSMWEQILGTADIGMTDNFFAIGGTSLDTIVLTARMQKDYGVRVPASLVFQHPTIAGMAELIRWRAVSSSISTLVPFRSSGSRIPLFCIHAMNGLAQVYYELAQGLGPEQPVYGIQARGFSDDELAHTDLVIMAQAYANDIRTVQPHGPYYLAGWSAGATIAFEIARQLQMDGEKIELLLLIDRSITKSGPETASDLESMTEAVIRKLAQQRLGASAANMKGSSMEQLLGLLLSRSQAEGIVPQGISLEQFRRYIGVLAGNEIAIGSYFPSQFTGNAVLVWARQNAVQEDYPWTDFIRGEVRSYEIDTDHHNILNKPAVTELVRIIEANLNSDELKAAQNA
jgi:thioesterase domain-containing protein/acyl carrier protein